MINEEAHDRMVQCYQDLATAIQNSTSEEWDSAWLQGESHEDWGEFSGGFTTPTGDEKWFKVQIDLEDRDLIAVLQEMQILTKHPEQEPWKKVKFILNHDGNFHVDFIYDD